MAESGIALPLASLCLKAAQEALGAGAAAAQAIGVPMALVAVDRSGHVVASSRMDGASAMTLDIAFKKAWTSAMASAPTSAVMSFVTSDQGSTMSMPQLANFSVIAGGLPIMSGKLCVGGLGVSGASADLDLKVAQAAVSALAE